MREIQEYTAEVFRRSEKRIKERRKIRNRILAVCIPFCLIVAVWSVAILPTMLPINDKNMSTKKDMNFVNIIDCNSANFVQVEVEIIGNTAHSYILKDDANEVAQLYNTVQASFVSSGGGNKESAGEEAEDDTLTEENKDYSQSGTTDTSSGYRIIFTTENGMQTIYSLIGEKLINETTKQKTILTANQYSNLLNMLGLTITREEDSK